MATYKEHYEEENAFGDHWLRKHIGKSLYFHEDTG